MEQALFSDRDYVDAYPTAGKGFYIYLWQGNNWVVNINALTTPKSGNPCAIRVATGISGTLSLTGSSFGTYAPFVITSGTAYTGARNTFLAGSTYSNGTQYIGLGAWQTASSQDSTSVALQERLPPLTASFTRWSVNALSHGNTQIALSGILKGDELTFKFTTSSGWSNALAYRIQPDQNDGYFYFYWQNCTNSTVTSETVNIIIYRTRGD